MLMHICNFWNKQSAVNGPYDVDLFKWIYMWFFSCPRFCSFFVWFLTQLINECSPWHTNEA